MADLIDRQAAMDLLWKALYDYEDETEKQFQESDELDIEDWFGHRIFVQNMNDIDRQTILKMPSVEAEPVVRCKDCKWFNTTGCAIKIMDESDKPHEDDFCSFAERKTEDAVEVVRCKDCKNSEHWYRDRRRCFLWNEDGVSVFDDGFCNYGELKQ